LKDVQKQKNRRNKMSEYGFTKEIGISYDKALEVIVDELNKEAFGILTEIDVKQTLKKKLNVDFPKYKILGACNPSFAYKALSAEENIGLLLPCNVIVYEKDGKTILSVLKPSVAMGMIDNTELGKVAIEVESKLKRVFDSVN